MTKSDGASVFMSTEFQLYNIFFLSSATERGLYFHNTDNIVAGCQVAYISVCRFKRAEDALAYINSDDLYMPFSVSEKKGSTRPSFGQGTRAGYVFFDTSIGKPIWWTGTDWIDATGATV
jgi:hypothetical protein